MARDHFRALPRRQVSLAGMLTSADRSWEREARITDLGLGGACVVLPDPVPVGAVVRLSIVAPHLWDPLVLDAEVAWAAAGPPTAGTRAGLRFDRPPGPILRLLTDLLETHRY